MAVESQPKSCRVTCHFEYFFSVGFDRHSPPFVPSNVVLYRALAISLDGVPSREPGPGPARAPPRSRRLVQLRIHVHISKTPSPAGYGCRNPPKKSVHMVMLFDKILAAASQQA